MPELRRVLRVLWALCLPIACLIGAMLLYRLAIDPLLDRALGLDARASSIVRRVNIFLVITLAYWAFARHYERRIPRELLPRLLWTSLAALAGALSIGVTILTLYATGHYHFVSFRGLAGAPDILGQIWIAAVLEELLFRAILFRILEEKIGLRAALALSSVLFAVAHSGNRGVRWVTFISVALAGLMWALVYHASRNVWVVAAHHCCWNAAIFVSGLPLSGEDWRLRAPIVTAVRGPISWTGGAFGPEDSLLNIAVSAALCIGLWQIARRSLGARATVAGAI